jgi:thiamine-monophosphate kinase
MKEFSLIESLSSMLNNSSINLGVGDDAALFGKTLIAKDIMVENVHFTTEVPFINVMRKLVTANVSDIAAMGGTAKYALLGIAIPVGREIKPEDIIKPIQRYGVELIGGDTTSSKEGLMLSLTIIGERNEHLLTRSGANEGDLVYISRPVGRVRQLLERELEGFRDNYNHYLVKAETELGDLLGKTGIASSCIDISDGIGQDASHISKQSGVSIVIEEELVPVDHLEGIESPAEFALSSGEEFALLFTIPSDKKNEFEIIAPKALRIGYTGKGEGVYIKQGENLKEITGSGYEHTF